MYFEAELSGAHFKNKNKLGAMAMQHSGVNIAWMQSPFLNLNSFMNAEDVLL